MANKLAGDVITYERDDVIKQKHNMLVKSTTTVLLTNVSI